MTAFTETVVIRNRLTELPTVRAAVARAVSAGRFPERYLNRLQIAVDEAVTNIIEHGYESRSEGDSAITLNFTVDADAFKIDILDEGFRFDPRKLDDVDIAKHVAAGHTGGLGIFLMRKIMDVVEYQYETGRHNRLTLVKRSG